MIGDLTGSVTLDYIIIIVAILIALNVFTRSIFD